MTGAYQHIGGTKAQQAERSKTPSPPQAALLEGVGGVVPARDLHAGEVRPLRLGDREHPRLHEEPVRVQILHF